MRVEGLGIKVQAVGLGGQVLVIRVQDLGFGVYRA